MVVPKIQSAHNSEARNIINKAIEVLNVQGKTIQDLVAEGQLTEEQYAELLTTINGLVKSGNIDKSDLTPEFKEKIEVFDTQLAQKVDEVVFNPSTQEVKFYADSKLTNVISVSEAGNAQAVQEYIDTLVSDGYIEGVTLARDSVTWEKTNFLEPTKNLLDTDNLQPGKRVNANNGTTYDAEGYNSSGYIPVKSSSDIARTEAVVVFYSDTNEESFLQAYPLDDSPIQSPAAANYMRVSVRDSALSTAQIEYGTKSTPYEPYTLKVKNSYTDSQLKNFIEPGGKDSGEQLSGLINSETYIYPSTNEDVYSYLFSIQDKETYILKRGEGGNRFNVFTLNDNPKEIESSAPILRNIQIEHTSSPREITFTNDENAKFLLVVTNFKDANIPTVELIGSPRMKLNLKDQSVAKHHLSEEVRNKLDNTDDSRRNYSFNFYAPLNTLYTKEGTLENFPGNTATMPLADYHAFFQSLIEPHENANYELRGEVSEQNLPIYKYEIKPPEYLIQTDNQWGDTGGRPVKIPKVILSTGIHAVERSPNFSAYYLFKEILENPENNEIIEFLKMNVHIICVPIIDPVGWEGTSLHSNLNNNFIDQSPNTDPAVIEAKIIKDVIDENPDADLHLDWHNMAFRDGKIGYSMTNNEKIGNTLNIMFRNIGREYQKKYPEFPQSINQVWGHNSRPNPGTIASYSEREHGMDSTTIEVIRRNDWLGESNFGESVTRMGLDFTVNAITGLLRTKT